MQITETDKAIDFIRNVVASSGLAEIELLSLYHAA
jgi:hypothetical protein